MMATGVMSAAVLPALDLIVVAVMHGNSSVAMATCVMMAAMHTARGPGLAVDDGLPLHGYFPPTRIERVTSHSHHLLSSLNLYWCVTAFCSTDVSRTPGVPIPMNEVALPQHGSR